MLVGKLVSTIGSEHNEKAMRSNQVIAMAREQTFKNKLKRKDSDSAVSQTWMILPHVLDGNW